MLYLAEVLKKSGVFGGGKADLKLLACQRGEYNWSAVPGEEVVPADDAGNFNSGTLVLAELNANKQVQGTPREAGSQLVKILQSFSRFQEKFKTQEEEIEQWKQSLTYQSQELNRREMEMEAQREELENVQSELAKLEAKRTEIESSNSEIESLRAELNRSRSELESAWTQLHGEREALQQQQSDLQQASTIDAEQANSLQQWLTYLSDTIPQGSMLQMPFSEIEVKISAGQAWLEERQAQLEQWRSEANGQQADLDRALEDLDRNWQQWRQQQGNLEQQRVGLTAKEQLLDAKQEFALMLKAQVRSSDDLLSQISNVSTTSGDGNGGSEVDWTQLEQMPLNELQHRVRELQNELETGLRLVIDEQEELIMQRLELNELEAKLARAGDSERAQLQAEMADQQESYKFLNETLIGQRRSLRERERIVNQHQSVLWRRLGNSPEAQPSGGSVDLSPLLSRANQQRQQQQEQVNQLEGEIDRIRQELDGLRQAVEQQTAEGERQLGELQQQDRELHDRRSEIAQLWGRVNTYQEVFEPLRERLDEFKSSLESLSQGIAQLEETVEAQRNAVVQLQESISAIAGDPAVA
ncbi:MAG: hypothetical protein J7642_15340 [Cyanobacteria bacterium SBC]|nr:hypothetical protein [Cyanobacteria bacterium SBC]